MRVGYSLGYPSDERNTMPDIQAIALARALHDAQLAAFRDRYPETEGTAFDALQPALRSIRVSQARHLIDAGWLVVHPDDFPSPSTVRVLDDVRRERYRQVKIGWTPDHDDSFHPQPGHRFIGLAKARVTAPGPADEGYLSRRRMIEGIAMLVAAVEILDRTEARGDGVTYGVRWSES